MKRERKEGNLEGAGGKGREKWKRIGWKEEQREAGSVSGDRDGSVEWLCGVPSVVD